MRRLQTALVLALLGLFVSTAAAKRTMPKGVSVSKDGIRYEAVHFGHGTGKKIQAIDTRTGKKLWDLEIYRVRVDPKLERDVQEFFIDSMKIEGDKLIMTNEHGEEFVVDLAKRKVISKKVRGGDAYDCKRDSDCTTTCAQGAINKAWYVKNRKGLGDCKDGCTRKGTKPARCIEGTCTRIGADGQADPQCTRKRIWYYTP